MRFRCRTSRAATQRLRSSSRYGHSLADEGVDGVVIVRMTRCKCSFVCAHSSDLSTRLVCYDEPSQSEQDEVRRVSVPGGMLRCVGQLSVWL